MDLSPGQHEYDISIVRLAEALARAQELQRRAMDESIAANTFGELFEALNTAEGVIFDHKDTFGVRSALFQRGCEEFVLLASAVGMLALRTGSVIGSSRQTAGCSDSSTSLESERERQCGELLARAEQHTRRSGYLLSIPGGHHSSHRLELRLTALNNLACFHQRYGRPWAAIGFLERALRLQLKKQTRFDEGEDGRERDGNYSPPAIRDSHSVALTRLNLAAVLSQLERHSAAVEHAKAAVVWLLGTSSNALKLKSKDKSHRGVATHDEEGAGQIGERNAELLLVAYYNLAVELEHTSDRDQAQTAFRHALAVAEAHPALLRMELVVAIERILHEYESTPRLLSTSPRRGTPRRGQWTPRADATAMDERAARHRPLSPRSLRSLEAVQPS